MQSFLLLSCSLLKRLAPFNYLNSTKMPSDFLTLHLQTIKTSNCNHSFHFQLTRTPSPSFPFPILHHHHHHDSNLSIYPSKPIHKSKIPPLSLHCSVSSPSPPTSKEEAILQAKTCLSTTLEKPLNNPKLAGKLKKLKQPRFRLEIPVADDDSPDSISQLALQIFGDMPIKRKGSAVNLLILWPNSTLKEAAIEAFGQGSLNSVEHKDISSVTNWDNRNLSSADVAVFFTPEASQLSVMKTVTDRFYPKPAVISNPRWGFDEEASFGELSGFVGSFEVVYSFTGLEVRGILSRRKGVIFKCVRDGVLSGERWSVLVEEEGELKVVSRFKGRPSIAEVENVLYNLMAINSPVTKSAKFIKDLVSNVTGKK